MRRQARVRPLQGGDDYGGSGGAVVVAATAAPRGATAVAVTLDQYASSAHPRAPAAWLTSGIIPGQRLRPVAAGRRALEAIRVVDLAGRVVASWSGAAFFGATPGWRST